MARSLVLGFFILFAVLGLGLAVGGSYLAGAEDVDRQQALSSMLSVTREASQTTASSDDEASIGEVLAKGAGLLILFVALLAVLQKLNQRLGTGSQRNKEDRE